MANAGAGGAMGQEAGLGQFTEVGHGGADDPIRLKRDMALKSSVGEFKDSFPRKGRCMNLNMKMIDVVAAILVIIGALNWGLVGVFNLNLVAALFGTTLVAKLIYILVGISGLFQAISFRAIQHRWERPHMA